MERVKGIFHEHKKFIISRLSGKRKQLLSVLQKNDLIKPWEAKRIQTENDHDFFRSIFDFVEHSNKEKEFIDILRDISDEIANRVESPPVADFLRPLPEKKYADLGSKVVLECELDKRYSTKWLKNKQNVKEDRNIVIKDENHEGKHTFTILQLKGSDIGKYSCICGSKQTTCELKITEPLKFVKHLENKICRSEAKVDLECKLNKPFDGEPIWTKDEQEISKSSPCFQKENTPYVKKLTIVKFDQNDEGEYQCVCDTASTKATIKISAKTESQARLTYNELEKNCRQYKDELQKEKRNVEKLTLEKDELKKRVKELENSKKHDANLAKEKIRETEEKIKEKDKEIRNKNSKIQRLKTKITIYNEDLQKKETIIQKQSEDVGKLLQLHKVTSSKQQEQDKNINKMLEGFKTMSDHETEKRENIERTKQLREEIKKMKEAKEMAEHNSRLAENAKEAAERQAANNEKTQTDDQARAHTFQKPTTETEVRKQKLKLTGNPSTIQPDQERARKRLETDLKQTKKAMEKANMNALQEKLLFEKEKNHLLKKVQKMEKENKKRKEEEENKKRKDEEENKKRKGEEENKKRKEEEENKKRKEEEDKKLEEEEQNNKGMQPYRQKKLGTATPYGYNDKIDAIEESLKVTDQSNKCAVS